MWSQIVFRIFSIILLACSFEYVLFTQQIPWNWIDWILVFVVPIITVVSVENLTTLMINIHEHTI